MKLEIKVLLHGEVGKQIEQHLKEATKQNEQERLDQTNKHQARQRHI